MGFFHKKPGIFQPLFICYFLGVQDSHNPRSCYYHSLFRYLLIHLLINLVTPQEFAHQSGTASKILLSNRQCKSKLIVYLQPERYKKKTREQEGSHTKWFLELKTARVFNKQHVKKSLCPTEMLWVELIMFFQQQRNIKQSKNRNGQIWNIFWSWNAKTKYNLSPWRSMNSFRSIQETFFAH